MNTLLPIHDIRSELGPALNRNGLLIIHAPTGSGKSTQIPQMLLDDSLCGNGRIVVLQPRRIAARMLARRVAVERGVKTGLEVGYQVRFDNCSTPSTRIKYETDGIILREFSTDPTLRNVSAIVFDEFHERHLYSDLMLSLAMRLKETCRPDLRLVVMSATLDLKTLEQFFPCCSIIRSAGRTYPVEISYLEHQAASRKTPVWDLATRETARILHDTNNGNGHILVFMPGNYEIRRTISALHGVPETRECEILPLHGELSPGDQDKALAPSEKRKIIISTNVAETSLTIDGVTAVVDSGLARIARFDPQRGINTLLVERISQAAADQRAGRAGRTAPGKCIRLWSEQHHKQLPMSETPEVHRVDISEIMLLLKGNGIDIGDVRWIEPPLPGAVKNARQLLVELGAISPSGNMLETGSRMLEFPLHPRISRMLVTAAGSGCLPAACRIAALIQERNILTRTSSRPVMESRLRLAGDRDDSDFILLFKALDLALSTGFDQTRCEPLGISAAGARAVIALESMLCAIAGTGKLETAPDAVDWPTLLRALLTAFPDHVCTRTGRSKDRCMLTGGRRGGIAPGSIVGQYPILLATEISEIGTIQARTDIRLSILSAIDGKWLEEFFPSALSTTREISYDTVNKRVMAEKIRLFHDLPVSSEKSADISDDESAAVFANEIAEKRLTLKNWDARVEQWIARVNLVASVWPELGIGHIDDKARRDILEQICHGAGSAREVKTREVWPTVKAWLDREQSFAVESLAPERITMSNGRQPRVCYDDPAGGPYIAMRIQELYDVTVTPSICGDRIRLRVHILAPNQRPVQITDNLASFWKNGYEQVKKDLRGRYPKHEWR